MATPPLEPQHLHAEHAHVCEISAKTLRDGAEVLAHDNGTIAMRLERNQPQHLDFRTAQVSSVGRRSARGHDPESPQAQCMVDAHAARIAHYGAQHCDEGFKSQRTKGARRQRGQSPVLSLAVEHVRRGADVEPAQQFLWRAPGVAALRVHSHGEIGDNPDRHRAACFLLRGLRASRRQPLQEQLIFNLSTVLSRKGGDVSADWRVKSVGPVADAITAFHAEMCIERLEQRMCEEPFAALAAKGLETRTLARVPERCKCLAQRPLLQRCRMRPVDQRICAARLFELRSTGKRRVRKQGIEEQPRGWRVGAEARPVGAEQRMRRARHDGVETGAPRTLCKGAQRREIAESAAAAAAQRINLYGYAGELACSRNVVRQECAHGRSGKRDLSSPAFNPVIAEFARRPKTDLAMLRFVQPEGFDGSVLGFDSSGFSAVEKDCFARTSDDQRRHLRFIVQQTRATVGNFATRACRKIQTRQHRAQRTDTDRLRMTARIRPMHFESRFSRERDDRLVLRHVSIRANAVSVGSASAFCKARLVSDPGKRTLKFGLFGWLGIVLMKMLAGKSAAERLANRAFACVGDITAETFVRPGIDRYFRAEHQQNGAR